jgi:hypothetical protein
MLRGKLMMDHNKYALTPSESRKLGLIAIACGAVPYIALTILGYSGIKCFFAGMSVAAMVFVGRIRKDLLRIIWFWIVLSVFIIIHFVVFFTIPDKDFYYPGIILSPFLLADILIMFLCVSLVERLVGKHD